MRRITGAGLGNRSLKGSSAGAGCISSEPSGRRRRVDFRVRASLPFAGDQFAALGLTPSATKFDVKRAYKRLALKYHPDVIRENGAHEKDAFREIKSAYESLMARFEEEEDSNSSSSSIVADDGLDDEWEEWDDWMGLEGGLPVLYNAAS